MTDIAKHWVVGMCAAGCGLLAGVVLFDCESVPLSVQHGGPVHEKLLAEVRGLGTRLEDLLADVRRAMGTRRIRQPVDPSGSLDRVLEELDALKGALLRPGSFVGLRGRTVKRVDWDQWELVRAAAAKNGGMVGDDQFVAMTAEAWLARFGKPSDAYGSNGELVWAYVRRDGSGQLIGFCKVCFVDGYVVRVSLPRAW